MQATPLLGAHDRARVNAVLRPWLREQDAVRVDEEIANAAVAQNLVDARRIAALGEPDALGSFAEVALELAATDFELSADRVHVDRHQGQVAVRRAAGDKFEFACFEEAAKAVIKIVAVLIDEDIACPQEALVIHVRELVELGLPLGAFDFLAGQRDKVVEVPDVAILQERVGEHAGERRRHRHTVSRQSAAVAFEAVEHLGGSGCRSR